MNCLRNLAPAKLIAGLTLLIAGILLLVLPLHATAATFFPTRFTVELAGTPGKPDVILLPGLSSSKAVWDGEVKLLAPSYRLHLVQVAGFAGAPAAGNQKGPILPGIVDELHQYITTAKLHPVVIGHSLGGLLALMLADQHPDDLRSMVLVDALPFYPAVFRADATVDAIRPEAEAIRSQILAMSDTQFAAMQSQQIQGLVKNPDAQKLVLAATIAGDRTVSANAIYEDLVTDLRDRVATIRTPTLLIYPYDATAAPDVHAIDAVYQNAYKPMPNIKLVRIDDSRHFVMYDQPAKFDEQVQLFLK